jgi:hypothetical protein
METYTDDGGRVRPSLVADFYGATIRNQGQLVGIHFRGSHVCMPSFYANASPSV